MSTTTVFRVQGMTCGHCVRAVEAEVAAVPGVTAVVADLASGRLEVASTAPVDADAVAAAVVEAGYEIVG